MSLKRQWAGRTHQWEETSSQPWTLEARVCFDWVEGQSKYKQSVCELLHKNMYFKPVPIIQLHFFPFFCFCIHQESCGFYSFIRSHLSSAVIASAPLNMWLYLTRSCCMAAGQAEREKDKRLQRFLRELSWLKNVWRETDTEDEDVDGCCSERPTCGMPNCQQTIECTAECLLNLHVVCFFD